MVLGAALGLGGSALGAFGGSSYKPSESELLSDAVYRAMRKDVLPKTKGVYERIAGTPMQLLQEPTDMFGSPELYALQEARGEAVLPMGYVAGMTDPQRVAIERMAAGQADFQDPFAGETFEQYLQKYQDPYQEQVIESTLGDIREQADIARSRLGEAATAAGGFGGSRQALEGALLEAQTQKNIADVGSQLRQRGLESAMERGFRDYLAGQDIRRQDIASQFGAGAALQEQAQRELDVARGFQTEPLEWYQKFLRGFPAQPTAGREEVTGLGKIGGALMAASPFGGQISGLFGGGGTTGTSPSDTYAPWGTRWAS